MGCTSEIQAREAADKKIKRKTGLKKKTDPLGRASKRW